MKANLKISYLAVMTALVSPLANAADLKSDKVEVVSTSPLPGIGVPINLIPSNIQTVKAADVNKQPGVSIADYMVNNMQGVTVSDMTGNPWQPEINFRGYSSTPLLGNAQGLSTYVDGVRVNESFGDVTLWDKIPSFAIGNMQIVPGSNPVYGLNTLGGAIAIQTKNGRDNQGIGLEYEAGSWGRQRALIEAGGVSKDGSVDFMFGYQHLTEDGWRKNSPSHLNQLFSKIGWQNETTRLDLTYIGTDNNLIGNGFTPEFFLRGDRDQIHTRPDFTNNYSHFLALNGSHWMNDTTMLSGNIYYRKSNRHTRNGDGWETDDSNANFDNYLELLESRGFGDIGTAIDADDIEELKGSVMNRTKTRQDTYGFTTQVAKNDDLFGKKNNFIVGFGYDYSIIRFKQGFSANVGAFEYEDGDDEALALVNPNVFDASRKVNLSGGGVLPSEQTTGLTGKQWTARLFTSDTLSLNDYWHLNAGASWNFTRVDNVDTLRGSFVPNTLTARDSYTRLNPSVGLTFTPTTTTSLYGSYSESSRAPTSIELGCSNPAFPCLLPAQMADDPPLNQVVAKTYELGGRGNLTEDIRWNAGLYRAVNHDDIQFTAANTLTGAGYFKNIGRTVREGFDLGLSGNMDKFKWSASYSYIRATYDTDVTFTNPGNSTSITEEQAAELGNPNLEGQYTARKGDRLPSIPKHQLKFRAQYAMTPEWTVGTNVIGFSDQFVWGNENNQHRANDPRCEGNEECSSGRGKLGGYFVVNLDTQYNLGNGWKAFAKAINIFDRDYYVGGRFGETQFGTNGLYQGEESRPLGLLPGAPRAGWIGLRYDFGGPDKPAN